MKILAIGDFHGTFPGKFKSIVKKEKIDLVVSNGDYPPFHYRNLWFKHCYGKDVELWEVIGKQKYKKLVLEDLRRAEISLKALNALPVPVYTVLGNIDWPALDDVMDTKDKSKTMPNFDRKDQLAKRMKKYKNIYRFDYSYLKFGDYIFVGMRGHSNPGRPRSKAFRKHKKILDRIFRRFRKENREGRVIFVSHNIANNTRLDKIGPKAHKKVRGKHYGSKMARQIVNFYQPALHLGGHIHEGMGKQRIGKTWAVNPGSAHEGKGAIIDIEAGKVKNVKFIR